MDNENNKLGFLDLLNILSFVVGIMNLNENLTQGDKQELMQKVDNQTSEILKEVHLHLKNQDRQLTDILERLDKYENDKRTSV